MKGWRTIILNGAMLALALTDWLVANGGMFASVIGNPKRAALAVVAVNLVNIALRFITTSPVGRK